MKKILILAQKSIANDFLNEIDNLKDKKEYILISQDEFNLKSNFTYKKLDPTNIARIKPLLINENIEQAYILLEDEEEIRLAYDGVRSIFLHLHIILCSSLDYYANDSFCTLIQPNKMLCNHLIDLLPNVPMIARYIGLAKGEIMQVRVPDGSIYANKHISSISQEFYKIALIYRNNEYILPSANTQILQNDKLLLVGDPNFLNLVFSRIKGQVGQFPSPYADMICCIIDMNLKEDEVIKLINTSLLLHAKSNSSNLLFYVLNPTLNKALDKLNNLNTSSIKVKFFYEKTSLKNIVMDFTNNYSGIFVLNKDMFYKNMTLFYKSALPILKIGKKDFSQLKQIACISSGSLGVENLSSVILDFSLLFSLEASIFYFDQQRMPSKNLIEHINTQSSFFNAKLDLIEFKNLNPIFHFKNNLDILQCLGFDKSMLKNSTLKYFKNDFSKLHKSLEDNYQLYIPYF